jgi:hypothetical protein
LEAGPAAAPAQESFMSTVAKILVVLNLGLAAAFLGSAANYLGYQETFKSKLTREQEQHAKTAKDKQAEIDLLITQKGQLSDDLQKTQNNLTEANANRQRLETENKNLKELFAALAGDLDRAQKSIESMTRTIDSNRTLIDQLQASLNEQRQNLRAAQSDRDAAVNQVNALELQLQAETEKSVALEQKLQALSEERDRIAFALQWFKDRFPGASPEGQPAHEGRVIAADNERNVFVISLGEEDGVKAGFQYTISRGSQYVGTLQVDDVQAKQAAGYVLSGFRKMPVQRGDVVTSK